MAQEKWTNWQLTTSLKTCKKWLLQTRKNGDSIVPCIRNYITHVNQQATDRMKTLPNAKIIASDMSTQKITKDVIESIMCENK